MAYKAQFLRLVMVGTTYPGEAFSIGLNMISKLGGGAVPQPLDITPYTTACKNWFGRNNTQISQMAKLTTVKLNLIGVNGLYVNQGFTYQQEVVPPVPGSAGNLVPAQISQAVTLSAVATRGLASKGRIFPPLSAALVDANGVISAANCGFAADSMVLFINELNAIAPSNLQVGLVSDVRQGEENGVRGVSVGRVLDTQRRRRSSILDVRVPATEQLNP